MHVEADVLVFDQARLAGMDPDADTDLAVLRPVIRRQCLLRLGRSRDRSLSGAECHEQGVRLAVDLKATMSVERTTKQDSVLVEQLGVSVARALQQPRRTLDVAEKEGDRTARGLYHRPRSCPETIPLVYEDDEPWSRFKTRSSPHPDEAWVPSGGDDVPVRVVRQ
jgi:hypothetical protein